MNATPLLRFCLASVICFTAGVLQAADKFPGKEWEVVSPEKLGWSVSGLEAAKAYSGTINTAAVVVVHKGQIVAAWGEIERPFNCHSMRKSILSALFGVHVASGKIDLDKTLEELGIDDKEPSLSETERKATVRDLLKARSGIYHPALYETASMKAARPKRHSHAPGEFWYYNNWDFNALGTIFEQQTASSIFEEFERQFAGPLGMQDFIRAEHTVYVTGPDSVHPAYPIILSARDLARFGLLFARGGRWGDKQLIPEQWVKESTQSYSEAGGRGGYGYMWWVAKDGVHYDGGLVPAGSFSARGAGGHCMLVVPAADLVVVHRVDTFKRNNSVSSEEQGKLIHLILAAAPAEVKALPTKVSEKPSAEPKQQSNIQREATFPVAVQAADYDLLFVNGRIMDGTGNPWFQGDVGVRDGKIVAVGRLDQTRTPSGVRRPTW
jgi:CubicO group peptidase (beta-lactamase class C family)